MPDPPYLAFPTSGILAEDPVVETVSDPEQGRREALEGSLVEGELDLGHPRERQGDSVQDFW